MTGQPATYKILLVEDDRSIQVLVTEALHAQGITVIGVGDGRDAIPRALDFQPDLVLLDIALPGMNGWDILAEIRTLEDTANVPVIIITAHGQSDWEAVALRRGADLFIEKPFRIAVLVKEVAKMLANGRPAVPTRLGNPSSKRVSRSTRGSRPLG